MFTQTQKSLNISCLQIILISENQNLLKMAKQISEETIKIVLYDFDHFKAWFQKLNNDVLNKK